MSEGDRLYRNGLMRDFKSLLPALVRTFRKDDLEEAINKAFEDYQTDMEEWEVIGNRNTRSKQRELDSGHAVIKEKE